MLAVFPLAKLHVSFQALANRMFSALLSVTAFFNFDKCLNLSVKHSALRRTSAYENVAGYLLSVHVCPCSTSLGKLRSKQSFVFTRICYVRFVCWLYLSALFLCIIQTAFIKEICVNKTDNYTFFLRLVHQENSVKFVVW